jgi:hypothetical protein
MRGAPGTAEGFSTTGCLTLVDRLQAQNGAQLGVKPHQ